MTAHTPLPPAGAGPEPLDEIIDLTDRRRILVRLLFGVDVDETVADRLFALDGHSSSTTTRSAGRRSSTVAT